MRTAIYGCGAMGTVLGAFLNRGGARVDLIDSYGEHVKALNEKGAALVGFENFTQPVHALLPEQMQGVYDLVILMTKQTANQAAFAKIAPHVGAGSAVLTLQNGVPEPGVSACFGEDRTLGGTIEWGATFRGPGVSEVTQPLTGDYVYFNIGTVSGVENDRVRAAAGLLRLMGPTSINPNLMAARWSKLIWNCGMSGMSAALRTTFGGVLDSPKAMVQVGRICAELGQVCKAAGQDFDETELPGVNDLMKRGGLETERAMSQVFAQAYVGLRTAKASMLQDLEHGRITEVDMINGFVGAQGRRWGVPTPINDLVTALVHEMEGAQAAPATQALLARFPD